MKSSSLNAHLNAAEGYAKLSKAKRLQVGAVLVKDDRIVSIGYNGTPVGWDNNCEDDDGNTVKEVIHAEANVILFAARNGTKTESCTLVITHSPCFECCKLIVQSGIEEVYYETEYRDPTGIEFLVANGVKVSKIGEM